MWAHYRRCDCGGRPPLIESWDSICSWHPLCWRHGTVAAMVVQPNHPLCLRLLHSLLHRESTTQRQAASHLAERTASATPPSVDAARRQTCHCGFEHLRSILETQVRLLQRHVRRIRHVRTYMELPRALYELLHA